MKNQNACLFGLFAAGLLVLAAACFQLFVPAEFAVHCLFYRLFSSPCPTCGMTRALQLLLQSEWRQAFLMQPLVFLLPCYGAGIAGLLLFRKIFAGEWSLAQYVLISAGIALWFGNWIYLLFVQ